MWVVETEWDGVQGGPFFLMLTACSHRFGSARIDFQDFDHPLGHASVQGQDLRCLLGEGSSLHRREAPDHLAISARFRYFFFRSQGCVDNGWEPIPAREAFGLNALFLAPRANLLQLVHHSAQPLSWVFIGRMQTNALFTSAVATVAGQ